MPQRDIGGQYRYDESEVSFFILPFVKRSQKREERGLADLNLSMIVAHFLIVLVNRF